MRCMKNKTKLSVQFTDIYLKRNSKYSYKTPVKNQ